MTFSDSTFPVDPSCRGCSLPHACTWMYHHPLLTALATLAVLVVLHETFRRSRP